MLPPTAATRFFRPRIKNKRAEDSADIAPTIDPWLHKDCRASKSGYRLPIIAPENSPIVRLPTNSPPSVQLWDALETSVVNKFDFHLDSVDRFLLASWSYIVHTTFANPSMRFHFARLFSLSRNSLPSLVLSSLTSSFQFYLIDSYLARVPPPFPPTLSRASLHRQKKQRHSRQSWTEINAVNDTRPVLSFTSKL